MHIIYIMNFKNDIYFEAKRKMLESSEERIKLLRRGLTGKKIEQLYIKNNHLRIICASILKEVVDRPQNKKPVMRSELAVEYSHDLCAEMV